MTVKLSAANLERLPKEFAIPQYRREDLKAGIVHFGLGNFHRAHQAVYLDDLFNLGVDHDWAIIGAGVRPADEAMRQTLKQQDYLTTVVEQEAHSTSVRVTAAMIDFIKAGDSAAVLTALVKPDIRIVSLTITEGGYYISPATQEFDPTHPDIVRDAQAIDSPQTVFGLIVAALMRRRAAGIPPFAVMCCDNIPGNGRVTRNAVAGLAELLDPELAKWIIAQVAFPDSMIDRITPATTDRERAILADTYGVEDNWPVFCEEFRQWVVEDDFPLGRPAFEKVGVTFTHDVAPYELMKLRILNGAHAAIAYPAALLDIKSVHEAMEDADIRSFLAKLMTDEVIPILPPFAGSDPAEYFQNVQRRFLNPKVADTILRLAQDGSNRQPKFILPTTADRLRSGLDVVGLSLVSALWCRCLCGLSDSDRTIVVADVNGDRLKAAASKARREPQAFLALTDIFGALSESPVFQNRFAQHLECLARIGTRETLKRYNAGEFAGPEAGART